MTEHRFRQISRYRPELVAEAAAPLIAQARAEGIAEGKASVAKPAAVKSINAATVNAIDADRLRLQTALDKARQQRKPTIVTTTATTVGDEPVTPERLRELLAMSGLHV